MVLALGPLLTCTAVMFCLGWEGQRSSSWAEQVAMVMMWLATVAEVLTALSVTGMTHHLDWLCSDVLLTLYRHAHSTCRQTTGLPAQVRWD